jgi:Flp pilus assembly protein CpaB
MEASSPRSRIGGSWTGQLLASRRGGLTVAIISALIAGVLIYVFVQHYKKNNSSTAAAGTSVVYYAGSLIPRGTPGSTINTENLLNKATVKASAVPAGAITNPATQLAGTVASTDISKGSPITVNEFTTANISISSYLTGTQRALALNLDATHGLTAYVSPGDHVDVMAILGGRSTVLAQNVVVLANSGGDVVVRISDKQALAFSTAAQGTPIWLTLRPPVRAQQSVHVGSSAGA